MAAIPSWLNTTMPQHIKITTKFDITNTGIVRNFKENLLPAKANGRIIYTREEWLRCRRQQTNWETVTQIISLRTQPLNMRTTVGESGWILEFDIEFDKLYLKDGDPMGLLKEDFSNVPLLTGLTEHTKTDSYEFIVVGQNIWFEYNEL